MRGHLTQNHIGNGKLWRRPYCCKCRPVQQGAVFVSGCHYREHLKKKLMVFLTHCFKPFKKKKKPYNKVFFFFLVEFLEYIKKVGDENSRKKAPI